MSLISSLLSQTFNFYLIGQLIKMGENIFALLILLVAFVPGLLTMWEMYQSENRIWHWKILLFSCHPINVIIYPAVAIFKPNEFYIHQFQVDFVFYYYYYYITFYLYFYQCVS